MLPALGGPVSPPVARIGADAMPRCPGLAGFRSRAGGGRMTNHPGPSRGGDPGREGRGRGWRGHEAMGSAKTFRARARAQAGAGE
jgi:hypothetical protein